MDAVLSLHGDAGEKEEGIRPCDGCSDPVGQLPHVPDFGAGPLACPRIRRRSRLFTLAVDLAVIIELSFFYPSGYIIKLAETDPEALKAMSSEEIRNHYF